MKTLNLNTALIIIIAVMATWMVRGCLTPTPKNAEIEVLKEKSKHKEEMRLKDSIYYTGQLQGKDSVISVLMQRSGEKQVQYIQLKSDYGKIRPTVDAYSNSELLKRANGWQPE
jgi:small nuclear ribonucleoprotein (snRNP)-like protein